MEFFGYTLLGPQNYIKDIMRNAYEEPTKKEDVKQLMERVASYSNMPKKIPKLDGNTSNWIPWKYRMSVVLRGMDGIMDIVEDKVQKPEQTTGAGGDVGVVAARALYEKRLKEYCTLEPTALLFITNNISDETLEKVIQFTNPKDVWDELHRIFDGSTDDKLYDTCMEFFQYKKMDTENISTHISKIKNIWHKLYLELTRNYENKLPDFLLTCKILDTLLEEYFSFKSSWLMMSKKDRIIENITSQLCSRERALINNLDCELRKSGEAITVKTKESSRLVRAKKDLFEGSKVRCYICKKVVHIRKDCPQKNGKVCTSSAEGTTSTNLNIFSSLVEFSPDRESWYVDNEATHHVTMRQN